MEGLEVGAVVQLYRDLCCFDCSRRYDGRGHFSADRSVWVCCECLGLIHYDRDALVRQGLTPSPCQRPTVHPTTAPRSVLRRVGWIAAGMAFFLGVVFHGLFAWSWVLLILGVIMSVSLGAFGPKAEQLWRSPLRGRRRSRR